MPTLAIAYELATQTAPAAPLAHAIMALGCRWARPLASVWYVETEMSPTKVEALLANLMGPDDGLLVQAVSGEAALSNTMLRWTMASVGNVPGKEGCVIAWPGTIGGSPTRVNDSEKIVQAAA